MLTRPASRSGSRARTDSISHTQAPHCRPSIASDEFVRAVGVGGDEARQVAAFRWLRARRTQGRIEDPLRVVATEAESLDGLVCSGAAGAAEAMPGGGGLAAMDAGAGGETPSPTLPRFAGEGVLF